MFIRNTEMQTNENECVHLCNLCVERIFRLESFRNLNNDDVRFTRRQKTHTRRGSLWNWKYGFSTAVVVAIVIAAAAERPNYSLCEHAM